MEEGVCYAGISFYRDKAKDNTVRAALAHVFARHDYNILKSNPLHDIREDENGRPHLSTRSAEQIAEKIVDYYKSRNGGRAPERLVIHKTSPFLSDERQGFQKGSESVRLKDFIHLTTRNTGLRFFGDGEFPPIRGTLLSIPDDDRHFLYTTGYIPELATYPGSNIPEPIEIRPDEQTDSDIHTIVKEILILTKLDWNTTEFAVKEPVTTRVSKKVSRVLSDAEADPQNAETKYYYYM